jgi:hypothetical protein
MWIDNMPKIKFRYLTLIVLFVAQVSSADLKSKTPTGSDNVEWSDILVRNPSQVCCKICKKGKACGNSCISFRKSCHQPVGCACNGY